MGLGKRLVEIPVAKIASLENRLSGVLKPVAPRQEFINRLGQHMHTGSRPTLVNNVANWHIIALMVAGLASVVVGTAMIARALVANAQKKRVILPQ